MSKKYKEHGNVHGGLYTKNVKMSILTHMHIKRRYQQNY